jgi:hypothetical protein
MKSMLVGERSKKEIYEVVWFVRSRTSYNPAQAFICWRDGHVQSVVTTVILEGFMLRWWGRSGKTASGGALVRTRNFIVNEPAHVMPLARIAFKKPDDLTEEFAGRWRVWHQSRKVAIGRSEIYIVP